MAKNQTICNVEKENSVFATRLRYLFDKQNKTQKELSKYLMNKGQKVCSPQMVSNWIHGSEPNLTTIPLIADFFGVSTDYLLGRTKVKTTKSNLRAVCDFTGLSESAVEEIIRLKYYEGDALFPYKYACADGCSNGYIQIMDVINILIGERFEMKDINGKTIEESTFSIILEAMLLHIGEVYDYEHSKDRHDIVTINDLLMKDSAKWTAVNTFAARLDDLAERITKDLKGEQKQWQQLTDPNTTSTETSKVIE